MTQILKLKKDLARYELRSITLKVAIARKLT